MVLQQPDLHRNHNVIRRQEIINIPGAYAVRGVAYVSRSYNSEENDSDDDLDDQLTYDNLAAATITTDSNNENGRNGRSTRIGHDWT